MTIYATALLGGEVNLSTVWFFANTSGWQEIGGGNWRVSFTPDAPKIVRIMAMPKILIGNGTAYDRLVTKLKIVRVTPSPTDMLAIHSESNFEFATGDHRIRFHEASRTLFAWDNIPEARVGQVHTYCVHGLPYPSQAGAWIGGNVNYGSPLEIAD